MSRRPAAPDQAARDLIRRRLDVNVLVEAGAGSGKTESLAQRMVAGVLEGRYEVQHMAAVTFTRKAAAELRGRFQLTLERALEEEQDAARQARAQNALRHLERLFAGTIHAFCAHLLRERPVEAGVAPGFVELDEIADRD
jgi:ATP-dependent helicase/nuclease subunit A